MSILLPWYVIGVAILARFFWFKLPEGWEKSDRHFATFAFAIFGMLGWIALETIPKGEELARSKDVIKGIEVHRDRGGSYYTARTGMEGILPLSSRDLNEAERRREKKVPVWVVVKRNPVTGTISKELLFEDK